MASQETLVSKRETLNIRIRPEERNLIDQAARIQGKNRTDFVLEAARRAAEETLLERLLITVTPETYAAFLERLDQPTKPNERLRNMLQTSAPWD